MALYAEYGGGEAKGGWSSKSTLSLFTLTTTMIWLNNEKANGYNPEFSGKLNSPGLSFINPAHTQMCVFHASKQFYTFSGIYHFVLVRRNVLQYEYTSNHVHIEHLVLEKENSNTETIDFDIIFSSSVYHLHQGSEAGVCLLAK